VGCCNLSTAQQIRNDPNPRLGSHTHTPRFAQQRCSDVCVRKRVRYTSGGGGNGDAAKAPTTSTDTDTAARSATMRQTKFRGYTNHEQLHQRCPRVNFMPHCVSRVEFFWQFGASLGFTRSHPRRVSGTSSSAGTSTVVVPSNCAALCPGLVSLHPTSARCARLAPWLSPVGVSWPSSAHGPANWCGGTDPCTGVQSSPCHHSAT